MIIKYARLLIDRQENRRGSSLVTRFGRVRWV